MIPVGKGDLMEVRRLAPADLGAFQAVADELPNVAYFDTWDTFAAPGGGYTAYYRDGKQLTLVRADDGVHFNADGYTILMRSIAQFATQQFRLDPRTYEG